MAPSDLRRRAAAAMGRRLPASAMVAVALSGSLPGLCSDRDAKWDSQQPYDSSAGAILPAQFQMVPRPVQPPASLPAPLPPAARSGQSLFESPDLDLSDMSQQRLARAGSPTSRTPGETPMARIAATDAASLLGDSSLGTGIRLQRRTPIVTDPRSRGMHTGQLLAAGSLWVPARLDLDTMLSKIDSSVVSQITAIKGPYSVRYGPGFAFVDAEFLSPPRYGSGAQRHGQTSWTYETSGQQWHGRQELLAGSKDWGMRIGYGHRGGSDYETGSGRFIPSSYGSRTLDAAIGTDLSSTESVEIGYLRLDQSDVEFPGQIYDIDFLVTDAHELRYTMRDQPYFDVMTTETWFNRTKLQGSAQRSGKRRQIPDLDAIGFSGFTDVDSTSAGFRTELTWEQAACAQWTIGTDLRYLEQELEERQFRDQDFGFVVVRTRFVQTIPRSYAVNPGVFIEYTESVTGRLSLETAARVDWIHAQLIGPARTGQRISTDPPFFPPIENTVDLRSTMGPQSFELAAAYLRGEYRLDDYTAIVGALGVASRPPTLTELYAEGPFMPILQQGRNFVFGDPRLDPEQLWQIDVGLRMDHPRFRAVINGFYAWVHDYITMELGFAAPELQTRRLTFVNTQLATLSGGEGFLEYVANPWWTPFVSVEYVEGRDHTRDQRPLYFRDTTVLLRDPDLPGPAAEEPLPGIPPLESRIGVRLHSPLPASAWQLELSVRIADVQDRVATSLLEAPTAGFTTWDLRGYLRPREGLLLVSGVENLTNKHYREHLDLRTGLGVFQPGTNYYVGMALGY